MLQDAITFALSNKLFSYRHMHSFSYHIFLSMPLFSLIIVEKKLDFIIDDVFLTFLTHPVFLTQPVLSQFYKIILPSSLILFISILFYSPKRGTQELHCDQY